MATSFFLRLQNPSSSRILPYLVSLFVWILIWGCEPKEKPNQIFAIIIDGFTIQQSQNPGARKLASKTWSHPLPSSISVVFRNSESGETFSFPISTQFNSNPTSIQLAAGSYSYESTSPQSGNLSTLPVQLAGNLTVTGDANAKLEGQTSAQLISFNPINLAESPKALQNPSVNLPQFESFYYGYFSTSTPLKFEVSVQNGSRFHWSWDPKSFFHNSFSFLRQGQAAENELANDPDFLFSHQKVPLSDKGIPEFIPAYHQKIFATPLKETSALQWIGDRLFTLNDGGNPAELYEINPETGSILRTIKIENASNTDWEDLAASSTHLFIGDFGNNLGNRQDLKILKVPISGILNTNEVQAEVISFRYPEQNSFNSSNHRYDCESFIFWDEKLHLFTKPTEAGTTDHYILPAEPGIYDAFKLETIEAPGWITGADLSPDQKFIVFIGYENAGFSTRSFVQTFSNLNSPILNSANQNRFYLGSVANVSQTEGIAIFSPEKIKISGEQIQANGLTVPPRFGEIDLWGLLED